MHRRVGESELENALMREVTEVAGKGPGAGSRRLGDREKTPLSDRLRPAHPPDSMIRLPAIAPGCLSSNKSACRGGGGAVLSNSSLIPSPPIMPQDRARVAVHDARVRTPS